MERLTGQNFDRLAKAMMQRHHVTYTRARAMLGELRLHLSCGEEIRESAALQAAFLTSINTGKRAFRGGVTVSLPQDVQLRLPWSHGGTLREIAQDLGAASVDCANDQFTTSLLFGGVGGAARDLRVSCDGWRAALTPGDQPTSRLNGPDFAIGGVFAGGFAVARAFMTAAEVSRYDVIEPVGMSLWRPDLHWLDSEAVGPTLQSLPAKWWLLGLGHLGQAYSWTLGLLPFSRETPAIVYLQDFDRVEPGNWSAGLFCEENHVGRMKTRVSAEWLEHRGFRTRIIERAFDTTVKRTADEPRVALCGFDNPESRQILEEAGFELVVDAGLGASLDHFDRVVLRTFPGASQAAREIWAIPAAAMPAIDHALFEQSHEECGILLEELAGKAISSSFTGACASALVVGEVLRALHGGKRCEFLAIQLRDFELPANPYRDEQYQLRVARNGSVRIAAPHAA